MLLEVVLFYLSGYVIRELLQVFIPRICLNFDFVFTSRPRFQAEANGLMRG